MTEQRMPEQQSKAEQQTKAPRTTSGTENLAAARTPGALRIVGRYVRTAPASIGLAVIIVITSIITGTMFTPITSSADSLRWAAGISTTINGGMWWTPFTALFVPNDVFQVVVCVVLALTLMALAERLLGTVKASIALVGTGVIGVIIAVFVQWGAFSIGELWASSTAVDLVADPTVGIVGALLAASAFAPGLWRRRIRVIVFAALIMFVLYNGDSDNFYRLIAALLGLMMGAFMTRGPAKPKWRHSSHAEARNLIAAILAVTGLGPLTASLSHNGVGPLSFVSTLFAQPDLDDVLKQCADTVSASCDRQLALASAAGVGPLLLSLVPLALLLVAAIGLRRGRHFAYVLALVVNAALIVLSFITLGIGDIVPAEPLSRSGTGASPTPAIEIVLWIAAVALVPAAMMVILYAGRRHFRIRTPGPAIRTFVATVVIAFVVLAAAYFVIGMLWLGGYVPDSNAGDLLIDTIRRFTPIGFDTGFGTVIVPADDIALFAYQWVGPVFWAVFILAALRLYRATSTSRNTEDEARFLALLKVHGGGTLGFMGTWPGNVYWFSEDGQAAVAYRVINEVAITLSDPVCAGDRAEQTIDGFIAYCDANSWTPVFYSFHEQYLPIFQRLQWQHLSVGEETLMHPVTLDMAGKPWQKVRQALNRGIKENISTLWTTWDALPLTMLNQINAISEQWVSEKELPEMGFTLGGMAELKDQEVKLFLAIGPDGRMQAITSWLPTYRDGSVIGWTIDFMRRSDDAIPGIMEFVIASAALHMQKDGIEVLSLSGAPLATKPLQAGEVAPEPTAMSRLLEFLAKTLEPAYGFSSLFRFKSKFNPTYATMYMA
ncbi:MAG TPA: phosphatidylglycerol lysyltransferase domain-containing protein, partial [Microbacteriaceae bacterium]|nr:phosphatidylglycerol lysyltransferase domain-containing protein [Microbacteriaceae bacterium]